MELNENIMQLIIRSLNREASAEEHAELEAWINESAANRQEYEVYRKLWEDSATMIADYDFDTTAAWNEVQKKIQHTPAEVISIRRGTLYSFRKMAVAAAILIFILAGAYYIFFSGPTSEWETMAANDSNKRIALPDGSIVLLRKGSSLSYANDYGNKDRRIRLAGEGYFQVEPNPQKPFRISTSHALVEVLGTSFLVRSDETSDQVVVNTGRVKFAELNDTSVNVILTKGQKAALTHSKFARDTVLNNNYLAWESETLTFHNTPLRQAVEDISSYYQVPIQLTDEVAQKADSITLKAEFRKQTIDQVMDEIQLMTGLKIRKENGIFTISE